VAAACCVRATRWAISSGDGVCSAAGWQALSAKISTSAPLSRVSQSLVFFCFIFNTPHEFKMLFCVSGGLFSSQPDQVFNEKPP
jgi:hypothetical protein